MIVKNTKVVPTILTTTLLVSAIPSPIEAINLTNEESELFLSEEVVCTQEQTEKNTLPTPTSDTKSTEDEYAVIPDQNLLIALNDVVLKKGKVTTPILISELNNSGSTTVNLNSRNITDLTGIEHLVNIKTLYLDSNKIQNLSPLASLGNLRDLSIHSNQISDVTPLAGMTSLKSLTINSNQISDIAPLASLDLTSLTINRNKIEDLTPLAGLVNLTSLSLYSNQISDLTPLAGLVNLSTLHLHNNKITDISALSGMVKVKNLYLENNQIENIDALAGMVDMSYLTIQKNKVEDISALSEMKAMKTLILRENNISDLTPLSELKALTSLNLVNNPISDVGPLTGLENLVSLSVYWTQLEDLTPLAGLVNLSTLHLLGNKITDISPLAGLVNLTTLHLYDNQIENIDALAGMVKMKSLHLYNNKIEDVSPLAGMTQLTDLRLQNNKIKEIDGLSELTALTNLDLTRNQIVNVSPLEKLVNLKSLSMYTNQIEDISALAGMTQITDLRINGNKITDISALSGMTKLTTAYLYDNRIQDISPLLKTPAKTVDLTNNHIYDVEQGRQAAARFGASKLTRNFLPKDEFPNQSYFVLPSSVEIGVGGIYTIPIQFKSALSPAITEFYWPTKAHSPNGATKVNDITFTGLTVTASETAGVDLLEVELIPGQTQIVEIHSRIPITTAEFELTTKITSGLLSLKTNVVGPIDLGTVDLNSGEIKASANLGEFTIEDYTGLGEGWNLSVSANRLSSGNLTLPANSLFIDTTGLMHDSKDGQGSVSIASDLLYIDDGSSHLIAEAVENNGLGKHILEFQNDSLRLEVSPEEFPNGQVVDNEDGNTYTTTITFTLTQGI